jgi:long-subunit acyl-CoA synthetase (AMP-forming)
MVIGPNVPFVSDALQAIPAVQAVVVTVNTRLLPTDVAYLIEDSRPTLILVDAQFEELVKGTAVPVVRCDDSGRADDPYERLLAEGTAYDRDHGSRGWSGLEFQKDELATFAISYTSGTTSRPKGAPSSVASSI